MQNQNLNIDEGLVNDIFDKFIFNLNQLSKIENYSLEIDKDSLRSIQNKNSKSSLNKILDFIFIILKEVNTQFVIWIYQIAMLLIFKTLLILNL